MTLAASLTCFPCFHLMHTTQADVTRHSSQGLTPLHCLALSVPAIHNRISQRTLGAENNHNGGVITDAIRISSPTAFDISVASIADALLEAGASSEAMDNEGNTPLLTAAAAGCTVLCEHLLARGAAADARSVLFFREFNH